MGGWMGCVSGSGWLWCTSLAVICAFSTPAKARARLSESVNLFAGEPAAVALPTALACTSSECAAFYSDQDANGRVGGVRLDALGKPIEATRVDFGRSTGGLRAVAAGDTFVISYTDPTAPSSLRILLLDAKTLGVTRDLSSAEVGRSTRAMYSDGETVLLVDFTTDDVATTIDLATGAVVGKEEIADFWEPVVVPGSGQYLLFYPTYGSYRQLSSSTGAWLGTGSSVATALLDSFEGSGYFRDGVYQLIWRHTDPSSQHQTAQMFGMRVNAADGKQIDIDADGKPEPRVLCNACSTSVLGAFQVGNSNYFWFNRTDDGHTPLLEMNPSTGLRANATLNGADVSIAGSPAIDALSPSTEPRLLAAAGSIYLADTSDPTQLVSGEPKFPGKSSGVEAATVRVASNGDGFVAAWDSRHVVRAARVVPKARPAFGIDSVSTRELGFPELEELKIASAGGKYLIAGVHVNESNGVDLVWQVMDAAGQLGPLNTESTPLVLNSAQAASIQIGSDGTRYLVALFVGSFVKADGSIVAQRRSADGAAEDPFTDVANGISILDSINANFASPEPARRFAIAYRALEDKLLPNYLRTTPATGALTFETATLDQYQYVLANDGHSLLLGGGALLDLGKDPLVPRAVPNDALHGVSHWDGNNYVRLNTDSSPRLTVNQVSAKDFAVHDEELQVTSESVGFAAFAAGDGAGRSLLTYFASEGPDHVVALRGTLLETESELSNGEGGAGGEGGEGVSSAEAGMGGELSPGGGTANLAGATSTAGLGGRSDVADAGDGGALHDGGAGPRPPDGDQHSRACGCALPGVGPSHSGITLLALLALAVRRRQRRDKPR